MHRFWLDRYFWYGIALTASYLMQVWRLHSNHLNQCLICKCKFHRMNVDVCRKCTYAPLLSYKNKYCIKCQSVLFPVIN